MSDYTLPPVPDHPESCIADHWSPYELSAISAYGHACAEAARAPLLARIAELEGVTPEFPPVPPEGDGLPRYGIRWNGPTSPLAVLMGDGYWTPWHLADRLRADLETERMRLAACGVIAMANTAESAKQQRKMLPEYWSGSAESVAAAVDREMALRAEVEALKQVVEDSRRLTAELGQAIDGAHAAAQPSLCDLIEPARKLRMRCDLLSSDVTALRAASVIEWEPGRSYTAAELLRRAILGLRVRKGRPVWPAVMNLCGVGSNVAHHLCRWAGRDPDTGQEIVARPTPEKNNA